jgi:outer membrane autotransporter protein
VELNKTYLSGDLRWTPYASINAVHDFSGTSTYTVANVFNGSTSVKGTSAMAELGLGVQKHGWGFSIGAHWTDGGAFKSTVGGQAIVRFAW